MNAPLPRLVHCSPTGAIAPLVLTCLLMLLVFYSAESAYADTLLKQCTLKEMFGVTHSTQLVDFSMGQQVINPNNSYLLDYTGTEVPYQLLEDGTKIAFVADLPANTTRIWSLYSGRAPLVSGNVTVDSSNPNYYEITNGLTGVRVTRTMGGNALNPLAPIQGVKMRDGAWTVTNTNRLLFTAVNYTVGLAVTNFTVSFLEQGPLKTTISVRYDFQRPTETSGTFTNPAGAAYYTETITLEHGQASIMMEEDATADVEQYVLDFHDAVHPTNARYRGYGATSAANGYEPGGGIYRTADQRPSMDATVDLAYATPRTFPKLVVWDPQGGIFDTGWYWQLYDTNASTNANTVGIFSGRASRAIGAGNTGVNISVGPGVLDDALSRMDTAGVLHSIYSYRNDLYYLKLAADLTPGTPTLVAANAVNPHYGFKPNGHLAMVATSRDTGGFTLYDIDPATGTVTSEPVVLDNPALMNITDPYAFTACTSDYQFLVLYGQYNGGVTSFHLYSRPLNGNPATFTYRDSVTTYDYATLRADRCMGWQNRNANRPEIMALPDNRIVMTYQNEWTAASRAVINSGSTQFDIKGYITGSVDYGAAIDPRTGDLFFSSGGGWLVYFPVGWTTEIDASLGLTTDFDGQGPNRRSLATSPSGNALLVDIGSDVYPYSICRRVNDSWERFTAAETLGLYHPQAFYQASSGKFLLVGRKDGILTIYSWTTGDTLTLERQVTAMEHRAATKTVNVRRLIDGGGFHPRVRFGWSLYAGVKGTDILDPLVYQPIGKQLNIHSGISLNKVQNYALEYDDGARPYGARYMERSILDGMISRCRTDTTYYNNIWTMAWDIRDIIDMWRDTTGVKTHDCALSITSYAQSLLNTYVNGAGIYDHDYYYWHGGEQMNAKADTIDQVLANEYLTTTDRATVKAAGALFANILWDNDHTPMQPDAGIGMGTANMSVQQQGFRDAYALLFPEHPLMAPHVAEVADRTHNTLLAITNEYGAEMGSAHYVGASMSPILNLELTQRMNALNEIGTNPFVAEDRLAKFAEFYINLMTPQEVRFGGRRKMVAIGDGSTEGTSLYGELATGFATTNATLHDRLMGAWLAEDKAYGGGNFGSSLLRTNDTATSTSPNLGNATFPGWCSVLRHGWDTDKETSIHFVNGDFYNDHRHEDQGSVVIYALGAPLSLDWGPIYYPRVAGAYQHSMVVPVSSLGAAWNADYASLDGPSSVWTSSTQDQLLSFPSSGQASAHFSMVADDTTWTRNVVSIHPNTQFPVLVIRDDFAGTSALADKVFTLNMMATGTVTTPVGDQLPTTRLHPAQGTVITAQCPSNGPVNTLAPGLNHFIFHGQQFGTAGVTPATDWDLYTINSTAQDFLIGNWGNQYHPSTETAQFLQANGRAFEESQHILRLKGDRSFKVLLLPYRKGQPRTQTVTQNAGVVTITAGTEVTNIADTYYSYTSAAKDAIATYDSALLSAYGLSAEGGPTEVVYDHPAGTITITAHGDSGQRKIGVPAGAWTVQSGTITWDAGQGKWLMNYTGGAPQTAILSSGTVTVETPTFNPGAGTYTSIQTVTINCGTSGATIRYTTDGSDPTSSSTLYTVPITVASTTTLKARAFKTGYTDSVVATATYTITISGLTNFLTASYTGTRNNHTGYLGYEFTPASSFTVTALGRSVSGAMTQNHAVKIWRISDQTEVAAVTVTPASPVDALGYKYELLGTEVTLASGVTYRIGSYETSGGDQWMDIGAISGSSLATIDRAIYSVGDTYPNYTGAAGCAYVPPTFFTGSAGNNPSMTITGGGTIPDGAGSYDYGNVAITGGTQDQTFTIQNTGTADLHLTGTPVVQISGTHAADFTVVTPPATTTITPSGSTTFTIRFDPSAMGTRTATISIANDDPATGKNPYDFTLTGTGSNTAPTVSITIPTAGFSSAAPATLNITANAVDTDGTISKVEFYNNGVLLGTDTSSAGGWTYTWENVQASGSNGLSLTAKAYDNDNVSTTSVVVTGTVTDTALKCYWKLDENTGISAGDASGTGNAGTLTGASWTSGKISYALSFNGSSNYVQKTGATGLPAANATQTISYWFYVSANPSARKTAVCVTGSNSGIYLGFRSSTAFGAWKNNGTALVTTSTLPVAGSWHHVAYVKNGSTHYLYVDGSQVATSTTNPYTAAATTINAGRTVSGADYWPGKVDEVRVYTRVLSAAEITALVQGLQ
ncbi:MAG: LamG-like jellyroll fold domain-containing protein [Armatimonadota bacterium]